MPVPPAQRTQLGSFIANCAQQFPDFRWTAPSNLHLTLRFIGTVEVAIVESVAERIAAAAPRAFTLGTGTVGMFGRRAATRVIWLGIKTGSEHAIGLASIIEAECRVSGITPDLRPFMPHVTLARARARSGAPLPALPGPPDLEPWRADELVLYSSRLVKTGAIHEPVRAIRLTD